jgi:predicted  nucleic acid-binding Zn-ribbon protein
MKTEDLIDALLRLNEIETALASSKSGPDGLEREREMARLRRKIPQTYLEHYQRRRGRGKWPLAAVVQGVCRSCFLQVPTGLMQELRNGEDLVACPNCGAYIYEPENRPAEAATAA